MLGCSSHWGSVHMRQDYDVKYNAQKSNFMWVRSQRTGNDFLLLWHSRSKTQGNKISYVITSLRSLVMSETFYPSVTWHIHKPHNALWTHQPLRLHLTTVFAIVLNVLGHFKIPLLITSLYSTAVLFFITYICLLEIFCLTPSRGGYNQSYNQLAGTATSSLILTVFSVCFCLSIKMSKLLIKEG